MGRFQDQGNIRSMEGAAGRLPWKERGNPEREADIAHLTLSARPPAALARGGKAFRGSMTETRPKYGEEARTVGIRSLIRSSQQGAGTSQLLGPHAWQHCTV